MKILTKIALYVIAFLLLLFTGYPFLYMVMTSLKSQQDFFKAPFSIISPIHFDTYLSVFKMGLSQYMINSVLITVVSVVAVVLFSALASYPLSRMKFKLNRTLFFLFVAGMMLPIHSTLIPTFILTKNIGLYDSLMGLFGPYVAFSLPVSIFIMTQFMEEIPKSLEEAAEIDGCNRFQIFWKVILPLLAPAISTVFIYNFIHLWTEFIFALVLLTSPEKMTLPLGLQNFYGEFSVNIPGLMAALTLATLPIIVAYLVSQEKVVKGLAGGAVKE
jgi:raffinose/stachyose/melibiose transport system permease protein